MVMPAVGVTVGSCCTAARTGHTTSAAAAAASSIRALNTKHLGLPRQPEFAGRSHVAEECGRGDDGGAGEVALAAESHAVLPVAIECRDRALSRRERVFALAEAGSAP